jgi:hypothetical protein
MKSLDDWYTVPRQYIIDKGASSLLFIFNKSLSVALMETFWEHDWQPWKFIKAPHKWWEVI